MTEFSCQLGPVSFTVMPGGDFGQVLQSLDFGRAARADVPRLASVRSDAPRAFSFPARVMADTKDEAIAIIRAMNRALSVSNTLVVRSTDASQSVIFRTFPSGSVRQAPVNTWEIYNWQIVEVTVTVEPYAYGDQIEIEYDTSAPCAIALDDMEGDYTAPLSIEVAADVQVDATAKLHSVYIALNEHPEWAGWLTAASGLTWAATGDREIVTDASAYLGSYVKTKDTTTRITTAFETSAVPAGDYIVLVRAKMNGASTGTVDIAGQERWTVTIPSTATTWRYYEVGDLSLPYSIVRGLMGSTMEIGLKSGSATHDLCVDQIVLLPYRAGYTSWHPSTTYDNSSYYYEKVYFDQTGTVFLDDVCHLEDATGAPIKSLAGEILLLVDEKDGDTDHTHVNVTLLQTPRYSLYR